MNSLKKEKFTPGQRWISDSEPELGLGLISEVEHRMLIVDFPLVAETRHYAKDSAPLSRISFSVDDEVEDREANTYIVIGINDVEGLLIYEVKSADRDSTNLPETSLNDVISLNQPLSRLISGQVDHSHWFQLRAMTLESLQFIEKSSLLGLCSARTELIPHQLFIANEVAQRYAPRVLLADEVGLGKTIEACLILQQQLFSGQASRVLIIVPESLIHQWLVELLRRFNLAFSIFDEERCEAIMLDSGENPFDAEQLVLCSSELFIKHSDLHRKALSSEWDLLIVDEAHHLKPLSLQSLQQNKSAVDGKQSESFPENNAANIAYQNIELLSQKVKGLILLTATPDQLGQESHFALLRLLDSSRFHSFPEFIQEQNSFIEVATLIESLEKIDFVSAQETLPEIIQKLSTRFSDSGIKNFLAQLANKDNSVSTLERIRAELISALLDRHGTGRILFRNTRKVISGFPQRELQAHALSSPELYFGHEKTLHPELGFSANQWLKVDPRIAFVEDMLVRYPQEKILFICADKNTVASIEEYLRLYKGVKSSVFHEGMSIVERDRSAAYFADLESGSQILLCSEIGSEGRNFQFSHHLILFDLPLNPDLLEQRIGRLDRIGQKHNINIHVPYLENTAQEIIFRWYKDGLQAFHRTNPAAYKVYKSVSNELNQNISAVDLNESIDCLQLLHKTKKLNEKFLQELNQGRDRLLEINSFNPAKSQAIIKQIENLENAESPQKFLTAIFDNFGIETEENSDHSWVINPGEHMVVDSFPAIPDHGKTITYQRELALHREEIQFVNWYHPLVEHSIDLVLQGDLGKSSIAVLEDKRFESGAILLESLYRVSIQANKELQAKRFMPSTTLRIIMDGQYRDLSQALPATILNDKLHHIDKVHLLDLLSVNKTLISNISQQSEQKVAQRLPAIIKESNAEMLASLSGEIKRLVALKQVNPNIRESEISFLTEQVRSLHNAYNNAKLQLEGVRLIFIA